MIWGAWGWLCLGIDAAHSVLGVVFYGWTEWRWRRWLPWYRRGLSALVMVIRLVLTVEALTKLDPTEHATARLVLALVASEIWHWNFRTARRNKDQGNDYHDRERQASGGELTAVQAAAFRRQAMEAA